MDIEVKYILNEITKHKHIIKKNIIIFNLTTH